MLRLLFFLSLFLLPVALAAQFTYQIDQSIPVEVEGKTLDFPWAGGLNAAQMNTLDLNGDSKLDLVVYDRGASKIFTFLNQNNKWEYYPEYESLFPSEVNQWMLLRDFNCDGLKDLFTSDPFGILVFVNTTKTGDNLSWRPYHPGSPLLTKGFSGNINIKVNEADIPAIDDIDGDGDLDVLNVKFVGSGTVEYHKNLSMERTGRCDSMQLVRVTQNFGDFEECSCGKFAFGKTCAQLGGGRTEHTGGKTLLTFDMDNDGDREILFSEETCGRVYLLENKGDKEFASMTSATAFPSVAPITMFIFPAPFLEDVNFDGKADLLASPNIYPRTYSSAGNFQNSIFLYTNTGTSQNPAFNFSQSNFLQGEMIDVGDYATPAFADYDADGDLDMFIGVYVGIDFIGTVYQYENIGTPSSPAFRLITKDYVGLSSLGSFNLKPQFADMDADGRLDLVMTATDLRKGTTSLFFLPNQTDKGVSVSSQFVTQIIFNLGQAENILINDINQDGLPDILLGTSTGAIEYWKNTGPAGSNKFILENGSFLGLGASTSRQNPFCSIADLDADGRDDLVIGNQKGTIAIYGDIHSNNPAPVATTDVIFNPLLKVYSTKNLGGRAQPAVINLFNADKPAIVVGNSTGGIYILKNDEGKELPPDLLVLLYPNPLSGTRELFIKPDRNVLVEFFSILGQPVSKSYFIPANQVYSFALPGLAPGIYIARFTINGKSSAQKFIVP
ncbi:MAG: T9SS type A sorting domain-containing protein [Bacteroidia bacterium]|nr:T9SS type A sorting domain-containing protein [Bacteroidia bacterium]